MDELKNLNRTLGFYFFNLKNLNSDFLGFLGFFKNLKKPRFLKPCQTALNYTRLVDLLKHTVDASNHCQEIY